MLVSELMTKDVATVTGDASINKAFQVLYEKGHSQLPVLEGKKLVGLVTEKLLAEVRPSKATTLSVYEINYLLSKTKVRDIMKKDVFTISPDALAEDAALMMYTHDIGSLPVILEDKTLVGIVTRLDVFKAFIELMGVNDKGTRISLEVKDMVGVVANISRILKEADISINHISNFDKGDREEIVIRVNALDMSDVLKKFEQEGYTITGVQTKR